MLHDVLKRVLRPIPRDMAEQTEARGSVGHSLTRCAIGTVMAAMAIHQILGNNTPDFAVDYAAAWAYWNDRPIHSSTAELLAECWPQHQFDELTGVQQSHPPFATLLALPFGLLAFGPARLAWCVVCSMAIVGAWQLVRASVGTCLATAPIWCVALVLGTHEPVLFALIGGAVSLLTLAPLCAGVLLGFAVAVKAYPMVLAVGLVLTQQWRCLAAMLTATAAAAVVAELIFGAGTTAEWLAFAGVVTSVYVDSPENGSLVRHVRQLVAAPVTLTACVAAGVLILPLARKVSKGDAVRPFVPVALLASPLSWRQYMGLTGVLKLGFLEQCCMATAGMTVLLFGMRWIGPPPDLIVHVPLVLLLFVQWGRYVLSSKSSSDVEEHGRCRGNHGKLPGPLSSCP